jgi:hypothetical protein
MSNVKKCVISNFSSSGSWTLISAREIPSNFLAISMSLMTLVFSSLRAASESVLALLSPGE